MNGKRGVGREEEGRTGRCEIGEVDGTRGEGEGGGERQGGKGRGGRNGA